MKKNKNVNFIVYIHIFLFAVAVIFYLALRFNWSLIIPIFAIFNFFFVHKYPTCNYKFYIKN